VPRESKLTGQILSVIKKMAVEGYNKSEISKKLDIKRQTVDYWCKKHEIKPQTYGPRKGYLKYCKFLEILKEAHKKGVKIKLNQVLREIDLHPSTANSILKKNPVYSDLIRSKEEANSEDKKLSKSEAEARLPSSEESKIIGFENGKYKIKTKDNYIYFKSSTKIHQGDPRNKSGTVRNVGEISKELKALGYEYVEGYTKKRAPLTAKHLKCGNLRTNKIRNFYTQKCPFCSNTGVSKAEKDIENWVRSLGLETRKLRFKGKTKGKEVDIYIPSLNLAIEYCGLYWHNENSPEPRGRSYHYDKMKKCEESGIRLITIFEDEWVHRKSQVKNFLKSVFGIFEERIYARSCSISEVKNSDVLRMFLEENHIQGKACAEVAYGLYFQDKLLGLVTGNEHHRQSYSDTLVLNRLVFKDGVQIVGGASRLLSKLKDYAIKNGYKKILSWSDNRWSEGRVYKKCGFNFLRELKPDYSYVKNGQTTRSSKQSNKKSNLLKKGAIGNTEAEMAKSLKLNRIWDCGKKAWEIEL